MIEASPATIRAVMMYLEDKGFLRQPHTSAGRLPTQRGYRYFVDHCLIQEDEAHEFVDLHEALRFVSGRSRLFTAMVNQRAHTVAYYGVETVLQSPEFTDPHCLRMFGRLVDALYSFAEYYEEELEDAEQTPRVFIERENPAREAQSLGVVTAPLQDEATLFFAIGPSRMDYGSAISAVRAIAENPMWH